MWVNIQYSLILFDPGLSPTWEPQNFFSWVSTPHLPSETVRCWSLVALWYGIWWLKRLKPSFWWNTVNVKWARVKGMLSPKLLVLNQLRLPHFLASCLSGGVKCCKHDDFELQSKTTKCRGAGGNLICIQALDVPKFHKATHLTTWSSASWMRVSLISKGAPKTTVQEVLICWNNLGKL